MRSSLLPILAMLVSAIGCEEASKKADAARQAVDLVRAVQCADGDDKACAEQLRREEEGCEKGRGHDCTLLGITYQVGKKVTQDEKVALSYFEKACAAGDASGCWYLGSSYERGRGVEADPKRAATHYEQGCAGGEPNGCHALAVLYQYGRGVTKDVAQAIKHYQRECDLVPKRVEREGCLPVERLSKAAQPGRP